MPRSSCAHPVALGEDNKSPGKRKPFSRILFSFDIAQRGRIEQDGKSCLPYSELRSVLPSWPLCPTSRDGDFGRQRDPRKSGDLSGHCVCRVQDLGSQFPPPASQGSQVRMLAATQANGAAAHYERVTPKHITVHEGIPLSTISRTTCPTAGDVAQSWREQWRF
jgi:hypothetical protein